MSFVWLATAYAFAGKLLLVVHRLLMAGRWMPLHEFHFESKLPPPPSSFADSRSAAGHRKYCPKAAYQMGGLVSEPCSYISNISSLKDKPGLNETG